MAEYVVEYFICKSPAEPVENSCVKNKDKKQQISQDGKNKNNDQPDILQGPQYEKKETMAMHNKAVSPVNLSKKTEENASAPLPVSFRNAYARITSPPH